MRTVSRRQKFIGVAVFALVMLWPGTACGSLAKTSDFCKRDLVVEDFLAPLDRFPDSQGFSLSGRLRAGPAVLRVFPPREALVLASQGRFESRAVLADNPPSEKSALNWEIASELRRISEGGVHARVVKSKRQFVAKVVDFAHRNFGFVGQVKPGTYRLDVTFENRVGKELDHRAEFFQVVRPRSKLRLAVSPESLLPGSIGDLRVENYGTIRSTYSYEYRIFAVNDPFQELPLEPQFVSRDRPVAMPGQAGACFQFLVPISAPAGEYRVGVRVNNRLLSSPITVWARVSIG
jgi:hypothetical protein